jgi:hypothetical protein
LAVFLSGCVNLYDPESSQDNHGDVICVLNQDQTFTQGLISRRPGLDGIEIWINPTSESQAGAGSLKIKLFSNENNLVPVYNATVSLVPLGPNSPLVISIPSQTNSQGQKYTLSLSIKHASAELYGRNEDVYSAGDATFDGRPLDADMGFQLTYDYNGRAFFTDFLTFFNSGWIILSIAIIILLPGYIFLTLTGLVKDYDFGSLIAMSVAMSISIISLLMVWTTEFDIHWNRQSVQFGAGLSVAWSIWLWVRKSGKIHLPKINWYQVILFLIFGFTLATRLIMVRDLAAPPWVDSIHHALITRLIIEQGAYPKTYAPFINIETSAYHSGFHSLIAVFHWLSGLEIPQAMLQVGQVLNALIVFAVYLFAQSLTKSRSAGLFAALAAGLLSPMPAYYTSWGRYPQLAGLLILPASTTLIQKIIFPEKSIYPLYKPTGILNIILAASVTISGLILTHYRVSAFFVLYVIANITTYSIARINKPNFREKIIFITKQIGIVAVLIAIMILPWILPALRTLILPRFLPIQTQPAFSGFPISYLNAAAGSYVIGIAGLGWLLGILQRKRFTFILTLWIALDFLIANLSLLKLPGGKYINNSSVGITLFLPFSVLAGYLTGQVVYGLRRFLPQALKPSVNYVVLLLSLGIAFWGSRQVIPILNPITFLARQDDLKAIKWIEGHTNKEDSVLINPVLWGYGLYAGNDGGYWISALAGRITIPPPVLYGFSNDKTQIKEINSSIAEAIELANTPTGLANYMHTREIKYIYLGARGGIFSAKTILESVDFILQYHENNTWVFEVR